MTEAKLCHSVRWELNAVPIAYIIFHTYHSTANVGRSGKVKADNTEESISKIVNCFKIQQEGNPSDILLVVFRFLYMMQVLLLFLGF
jgi:hypothetical protein